MGVSSIRPLDWVLWIQFISVQSQLDEDVCGVSMKASEFFVFSKGLVSPSL